MPQVALVNTGPDSQKTNKSIEIQTIMADMITRCPSCDTSFRITEAQLQTARGKVRCGACLHIFKAMDYLVSGAPPQSQPKATPQKAASAPAMPKFEYKRPSGTSAAPGKAQDQGDGTDNTLSFDQHIIDDELDDADEEIRFSDDMALDGEEPKQSRGAYGDDLNESFLDLDSLKSQEKTSLFDREVKPPKEDDDDEDSGRNLDESWAMELLEDDEDSLSSNLDDINAALDTHPSREPSSPVQAAAGKDDMPPAAIEDPLFGEEELDDDGSVIEDSIDDTGNFPLTGDSFSALDDDEIDSIDREEEPDRDTMLRRIQPEPVEFQFRQDRIHWKRHLLWSSSILVLLGLLVVQLGAFQFESLSRKQPYRDLYAMTCPVFGCEVPPMNAPHLIRTTNFLVREHPEARDALMVDTILLNTASFPQPFPDLVITFSNMEGETLASRRFSPPEYLAGEMAGKTTMPVNQPVHLGLEIVNPGPDAVNYSAYIPR